MPSRPQLTLRERRNLRAHVLDELIRIDDTIVALMSGLQDLDAEIAVGVSELGDQALSEELGRQRALVSALLRDAALDRAEMRATQDRVETQDFGFCELCHEFIGVDRLLAVPTTTRCVRCVM
ncbi:MAG: TraR/DksA C4-type zinc finger protein [Ilumatobacteraceae bacterium]